MAPIVSQTTETKFFRFNQDGSMFCVVQQSLDSHRLVVWDTETSTITAIFSDSSLKKFSSVSFGREMYTEFDLGNSGKGKVNDKMKSESNMRNVVALGAEDGSIHIFSPNHGQILKTYAGGHTKAITDIYYSKDGQSAFSCAKDGHVVIWDTFTGKQISSWQAETGSVDRICVLGDGMLATAGESIKIWDTKLKRQVKAYIGFTSSISHLSFISAEQQLLSSSMQDRFINIWTETGKNHVLTAPSNVFSVSDSTQHVACVSEDGNAWIWSKPLIVPNLVGSDGQRKRRKIKSRSPDGSVCIQNEENGTNIPIIACFILDDKKMKVVRGNAIKPVIETVQFVSDEGIIGGIFQKKKADSNLISSKNSFENSLQLKISDRDSLIFGSTENPMISGTHMETLKSDSISIGDKLQALKLFEAESKPKGQKLDSIPKADSLLHILSQALHSNDQELLDQCLSMSNPTVVENTIAQLPAGYVLKFLEIMVTRFQSKPERAYKLTKWIKSILMSHMAYLVSLPNISEKLAPLYQTIDSRTAIFPTLLKLNGRLEVLTGQIQSRRDYNKNMQTMLETLQEPLLIYNEQSEDEVDLNQDEDLMEDDDADLDFNSEDADFNETEEEDDYQDDE